MCRMGRLDWVCGPIAGIAFPGASSCDGRHLTLAEKQSKREEGEGPSFEEGLEQLERIVHQLEQGEIGLDESLQQYEKGVKLLRRCYDLLHRADRRIELLSGVDAEGNPISSPMDDPAISAADRAPGRRRSTRASPARPPGRSPRDGGPEVDFSEGVS